MARVSSFVVCNSINSFSSPENGMISNIISPQIVLRPQFIPSDYSFGIAIGVIDIDLKQSNSMRFVIKDPDGEIINESGASELPADNRENTLPKEYQGYMICIDIRNLSVKKEGEYEFVFYINGKEIGTKEIPIFRK